MEYNFFSKCLLSGSSYLITLDANIFHMQSQIHHIVINYFSLVSLLLSTYIITKYIFKYICGPQCVIYCVVLWPVPLRDEPYLWCITRCEIHANDRYEQNCNSPDKQTAKTKFLRNSSRGVEIKLMDSHYFRMFRLIYGTSVNTQVQ